MPLPSTCDLWCAVKIYILKVTQYSASGIQVVVIRMCGSLLASKQASCIVYVILQARPTELYLAWCDDHYRYAAAGVIG